MPQSVSEMLPALIPVMVIELGLMVLALRDLIRRDRVRFDNKLVWGAIILVVGIVGPIAYFTLGREED